MIPVIDHALLVVALTGQAFISSDIDRGIWFTGLVQEPVEIGIVFQASIINFMVLHGKLWDSSQATGRAR